MFDAAGREIDIANRRGKAILAIACLKPGEPLKRELISRLIWPERFKPQARASLRQCLHDLKRELQALGLDVLELSNTQLAVKAEAVCTDLQTLEVALAEQNHVEASEQLTRMACLLYTSPSPRDS